jgi:DNA-binding SARP family transcriptional activator/ATP/maltotriose-dependent transcriptional regulator MalT
MASAGKVTTVVADGETRSFQSVLVALSHARQVQPGARVGIHAGAEAEAEALAAALGRRAEAGQVLVSAAVQSLAAGEGGHEFRELGPVDVDGSPLRAWELLWLEPEARTRVRLCGPLRLEIEGRDLAADLPGGQAGLLVRHLLARSDRAADRDELAALLWPHRPPKDPQAALRPILSRLRRALAPARLEGRELLRLELPDPVWVDVEDATGAVERARVAARDEAWDRTRDQANAAIALLRPGFLPGYEAEALDARRLELEELELEALEWVARSSLALGEPELGTPERASRELIARSPFRETGHRFLMEALARGGNVAEALRVYEDLRVRLRDELGTAPAAELQTLHGRLLAGEGAAPAVEPVERNQARVPLPSLLAPRAVSTFVGREPELDTLRTAWRDARAGRRRLVLIAGEPGIGKTRLTSEFAREAHDAGTVLYAGCQEEALLSYEPFVEALRHYARSTGLDSAAPLGPGAAELARLIPELAPARSAHEAIDTDPETRRYLLFDAVSTLLSEASARTPLLLVLDDLHWANRATLHLLRHICRAPREASLLIVGTYREAEIGPEHPLFEQLADLRRDRLFERISLEGLDEADVTTLIAAHAGHRVPPGIAGAVHEQTEGNPFFVEEVLRHLIETGVLFEREGRWMSALTADEIGVPEGVREVLGRRLGRLSVSCRHTLEEGAVLGREFSFAVVAAMTESGEEDLIAALEEAVEAQLAVEAGDPSRPAYEFTHALVRETLYSGLSLPRRQRMHARAAESIERVEGKDHVAALALHQRLAGPAGDPARAIEYSLRAGQRAAELSAWEEAAAHWDGALAVMSRAGDREPDRAGLLVALADLMAVTGDLGRQIDYLEQALEAYERLADSERAAQAHSRLGMAHSLIDSIYAEHLDIGRAFRHYDAARAVLERGSVRRARGHLEVGVSTALTYGLHIEEGIEAGRRGMEIAERLGDELLWAGAAQACGWHTIVSGRLADGLELEERAFAIADRRQRPFLAFMGSNISGQLTWGLGAPDEAQAFFERLLELEYAGKTAFRHQIVDGIGRCHASRGELEAARRLLADARPTWITHSLKPLLDLWEGRWDDVDALAGQILETSRRTGNRWDEWASHHLTARVAYLRRDLTRAAGLLEQALEIVVEGAAPYFELWVRPDLARVIAESGRAADARPHVERCREILAGGEDWRGRAGDAALADATVLAAEGQMSDADAGFRSACATLRRHGLRGVEADALVQWGRALARAGDSAAGAEKLERALELHRRCGSGEVWVRRLEAAAQRLAS